MAIKLPADFKDFLNLLRSHGVKFLLVGGYAVAFHGYPRTTADIDVWIAVSPENAEKMVAALREFGFAMPELTADLFVPGKMVRLGESPFRIEVLTRISGVEFEECYPDRIEADMDGVPVPIISLEHLRENKRASGRDKDLLDLKRLPK